MASVSVRFRSKERGTRVKDRAKNGASKRAGRGGEESTSFPSITPLSFFGSRFISRAVKTENPVPRFFCSETKRKRLLRRRKILRSVVNCLWGLIFCMVYWCTEPLNNVQLFLDRCYKHRYISKKLNIRELPER